MCICVGVCGCLCTDACAWESVCVCVSVNSFSPPLPGVKTDLSCEIASGLFINDRNASALTRALSIPLQICMGISTTKNMETSMNERARERERE